MNAALGFLSTTALLVLVKETVEGKASHLPSAP